MMKRNNCKFIVFLTVSFLFCTDYFYSEKLDDWYTGHINIFYNDLDGSTGTNPKNVYLNIILDNKLVKQVQMYPDYNKTEHWWTCKIEDIYSNSSFVFSNTENFNALHNKNIYNNTNLILENAKEYIINKEYGQGIKILLDIIDSDAGNSIKAESKYIIAEIYLNDFKDYNYSSELLEEILSEFSDTHIYKKALFTLAYVYANHLDYYTDAQTYYNLFLKTYPNDELVSSVEYELKTLKKIDKVVKELNK